MGVGLRIKQILRGRGMTIKQLAEETGVSRNTLYSITKRDSERVDRALLQKIADALRVDAATLAEDPAAPDREYEYLVDALASVGLCIEGAGWGEGPDASGDHFYVWHEDAEDAQEDRVELKYCELLRLVDSAQKSADIQRRQYLRQRLDLDLFGLGWRSPV